MTNNNQEVIFCMPENNDMITWNVQKDQIPESDGLIYMLSIQENFSDTLAQGDEIRVLLDSNIISSEEMDLVMEYLYTRQISVNTDVTMEDFARFQFLLGQNLNINCVKKIEQEEEIQEQIESSLTPEEEDYYNSLIQDEDEDSYDHNLEFDDDAPVFGQIEDDDDYLDEDDDDDLYYDSDSDY